MSPDEILFYSVGIPLLAAVLVAVIASVLVHRQQKLDRQNLELTRRERHMAKSVNVIRKGSTLSSHSTIGSIQHMV